MAPQYNKLRNGNLFNDIISLNCSIQNNAIHENDEYFFLFNVVVYNLDLKIQ